MNAIKEDLIVFKIPGKPKGKMRPRVSSIGGYKRMYTPKETRDYENEIAKIALDCAEINGWAKDASYIEMEIHAYFPVPESWSKKKRLDAESGVVFPSVKPDADNIAKIVCDALNGVLYEDDKQIVKLSVTKYYAASEKSVGVFVSVSKI